MLTDAGPKLTQLGPESPPPWGCIPPIDHNTAILHRFARYAHKLLKFARIGICAAMGQHCNGRRTVCQILTGDLKSAPAKSCASGNRLKFRPTGTLACATYREAMRAVLWRESDPERARLGRVLRGCTTRRWDDPLQAHCNANGYADVPWQMVAQNKGKWQLMDTAFVQDRLRIKPSVQAPRGRWMIGETL